MADPTKFVPGFDYSDFEQSNPTLPKPGAQLDNDFANVKQTTDQTIDALKQIRRSDGALKNGIVTPDSLSPEALQQIVPAATAQAKVYRDEAEVFRNETEIFRNEADVDAATAQTAAASATNSAASALSSANAASASQVAAAELVVEAVAGFSGFTDGQSYDFGSVATATTYFNQNWGTL
ncbi:hypothetical protein [Agrobacterium tumefaciens]|uniref:hypothetical protein n=1 Tax=Agrobacterium tumefaciens TaxID=358 RepID=UPI0021CFF4D7|nr:hypothetical protein [Agrobacterium tumefaciens]UXS23109.1 hypothetical protein FY153_01080 [Agrobacterium tumefaciens]